MKMLMEDISAEKVWGSSLSHCFIPLFILSTFSAPFYFILIVLANKSSCTKSCKVDVIALLPRTSENVSFG